MGIFQQSQSPVPGDSPGGLIDQATQGAMTGLIRPLHELKLLQAKLDESGLVPAVCRTSRLKVPSHFASVAKAFSFFGVVIQVFVDRLFHRKQQPPSKY